MYKKEADNTQLRYNGKSSYTVLTKRIGTIDFTVKHIFVVLRNIIGIVAHPGNVNILLKFTNEQNAQEICLERYSFEKYSVRSITAYFRFYTHCARIHLTFLSRRRTISKLKKYSQLTKY